MTASVTTLAAMRYGFGLRPGEEGPDGAEALLAQLADAPQRDLGFPREGVARRRETAEKVMALRVAEAKASRNGKPSRERRQQTRRQAVRLYREDAVARIAQAVTSPHGFHERLASFWSDHFAISAGKNVQTLMLASLHESEAIRPNLAGPFRDLLAAAVLHPAMLIYLDQNRSVGPELRAGARNGRGLNENLGRELIELHTLGAGSGYGQDDVRAAALILTGVSVEQPSLAVAYRPNRAEPGSFTLLGRRYGTDGRSAADHRDMLDDLARHPATATHICTKLVRHFISDEPPADLIAPMVAAWQASDGDLTEVYRAMLEQPGAWQGEARKIKRPFEFIVSALRAIDMPQRRFDAMLDAAKPGSNGAGDKAGDGNGDMARRAARGRPRHTVPAFARNMTVRALQRMGQPVWRPPSPAGFADETSVWLTPGQLAERIAWSRAAAQWLARDTEPQTLLAAALGDAARPETVRVVAQAPNRIHGLAMVLASPEFNRR